MVFFLSFSPFFFLNLFILAPGEFTDHDVEVFRRYLTFCGIGIQNAQLFEMSIQEYRRNQILLNLARSIFEEQNNLECLVTKILTEARELLKCKRCAVFLLDLDCCESVCTFLLNRHFSVCYCRRCCRFYCCDWPFSLVAVVTLTCDFVQTTNQPNKQPNKRTNEHTNNNQTIKWIK